MQIHFLDSTKNAVKIIHFYLQNCAKGFHVFDQSRYARGTEPKGDGRLWGKQYFCYPKDI
jgi:hypothetical protein